jgi:predicted RNA-binding protein YlxR (DUF448 family)
MGRSAREAAREGPARTCVACRREAAKSDLIRLVRRPDGAVVVDRTGRAPGRGAYLHRTADCIESARKKRALERALGSAVTPEIWTELV